MHTDTISLVLVRHAEAADVSSGAPHDGERPLTSRGSEDAKAIGRTLARIEHPPALILTSSLLRAVQTGELIASAFAVPVRTAVSGALEPGFRNADLLEELLVLRRAGEQRIVAIGHQPDVGNFIGFLIAGSAPTSIALAPGTAVRLTLRATGGRPEAVLHWLMPPSAMHALLSSPPLPAERP
jgi:phosphohistidine phosphatase